MAKNILSKIYEKIILIINNNWIKHSLNRMMVKRKLIM